MGELQAPQSTQRSVSTLDRLLGSIGRREFADEYWEKKPLLIRRQSADFYAPLLTIDDVDSLISEIKSVDGRLRIVKNGNEFELASLKSDAIAELNVAELAYHHLRQGATIVLNALDERWQPLRTLASSLSADLTARVQTNVYVTPAGNQGFPPHYDTHDVFILQVNGTKRWRLHDSPTRLPLRDHAYDTAQPNPQIQQEFDLSVGDFLYLPRGTVHSALANEELSIHITTGIHPILWADIIIEMVSGALADEETFRESLPLGFAMAQRRNGSIEKGFTEKLAQLWSTITAQQLADEAHRRSTALSAPSLRSHLLDIAELHHIDLDTPVAVRAGLMWDKRRVGDTVELTFHNKTVAVPLPFDDALSYLATSNSDAVTPRQIPSRLSNNGRVAFIQRLIKEGFLAVVRD